MENQPHSNRQYKQHSNSDFYDELEGAATLNQSCEITYNDTGGQEQKVISQVKDLYTEDGMEYVRLENQTIRLDSITSVNGKTDASGKVDTELLKEDMLPDDGDRGHAYDNMNSTGNTNPNNIEADSVSNRNNAIIIEDASPSTGLTEHGDRTMGITDTNDVRQTDFVGDLVNREELHKSNQITDPIQQGNIHQSDTIEDNLLGKPDLDQQHSGNYPLLKDNESDFVHRFSTSAVPFLVAENAFYNLTADRLRSRLYVKVLQSWDEPRDVPELGGYFSRIAPLMTPPFTLLNDLTALSCDDSGTLMAPAFPNKDILINAGLIKVADLVPYNCDTLVHGLHSFSVNSLRLRYFKDRIQAEHWLGDDHRETGTPDDMSLN